MSEEKKVLTYKGHPLMRKDNMIYYGSMSDSHIVMLQILETENVGGEEIAKRVGPAIVGISCTSSLILPQNPESVL